MSLALDMSLADIISKTRNEKKIRKTNKKRNEPATGAVRRQNGGVAKKQLQNKAFVSQSAKNNTIVRINVSNLAPTVISSDLMELFAEFKLQSASVNFDENGKPRGTGELVLTKGHADRLIAKFTGILLDDKVMKFALINAPNLAKNASTTTRNSSGIARKPFKPSKNANVNGKENKKSKKEVRPKMTMEELDAELDAYMSRGH